MKRLLFILIPLMIFVLAGAGIAWRVLHRQQQISNNVNNTRTNTATNTLSNINTALPVNAVVNSSMPSTADQDVGRIARIFVERYGSFSNHNNYENIRNVLTLMTPEFQKRSEKQMENKPSAVTEEYYGITTKVLSVNVTTITDTDATISLSTQRVESKGKNTPNIFTQEVVVNMEKSNGNWRVADMTWK